MRKSKVSEFSDLSDFVLVKEQELKSSQQKILYYKREIVSIKNQLEGSYNIDK